MKQAEAMKKHEQRCMQTNDSTKRALTRYAHAIAPIQRVPNHGPISYGDQRFWKIFRVGREGGKRHPWTAQNYSLEAW